MLVLLSGTLYDYGGCHPASPPALTIPQTTNGTTCVFVPVFILVLPLPKNTNLVAYRELVNAIAGEAVAKRLEVYHGVKIDSRRYDLI